MRRVVRHPVLTGASVADADFFVIIILLLLLLLFVVVVHSDI